jgi:polyphosphate kinase
MTDLAAPAPAQAPAPTGPDLRDPKLYFNRELSWMAFNSRVLELAEDGSVPLLERLKFCAIHSSNLDEFVMVRVAGLHDQVDAGVQSPLQDGRTPAQTLDVIRKTMGEHLKRQTRVLREELLPALAEHGVRVVTYDEVPEDQRARLRDHFRRQIFPVLTRLRWGRAGRSRTCRTCRCRSARRCATRRPACRRSRASRSRRRSCRVSCPSTTARR